MNVQYFMVWFPDPYGTDRIEFRNPVTLPEPSGHVISARITSENPDEVNSERFMNFVRKET